MIENRMIHQVRAATLLSRLSIIILFLISYSTVAGTFRMSGGMKDSLFSSQKQRVRITSTGFTIDCPLQDLNCNIHPDGITIRSYSSTEGSGSFSVTPISLIRKSLRTAITSNSVISTQDDSLVILDRGIIIEQLSSGPDGIRQDFIIPERPQGNGQLSLLLMVKDADVAIGNGDVTITLQSGRKLNYGNCRVFDAQGKMLAASMIAVSKNRIRITVDDQEANYPVTVDPTIADADWEVMNGEGLLGTDGYVYSMTYKNNYLYICGEFTTVGNIRAKNIARWNGSKWEPFGPEKYLEKSIHSLIFGGDNNLFAIASDGFYLLNGGDWKKLGDVSDIETIVYTIDNQGNLIVGGSFEFIITETQNNETELTYTKNIARWNATTQTWEPLGSEFPKGQITALTCDLNGIIYAAGTSPDPSSAFERYILKWDGSSWSIIASVSYRSTSSLECLACDRFGTLYVGGIFDTISGITARNIAKWNGKSWSPLGEGIKGWVRDLAIDQNGILYSTGFFESQDQGDVPGIACWDGNSWTVLGTGAFPKALETDGNGTLYICCDEMSIGSLVVGQIAQFSAGVWSALGKGINGTVAALTIDPAGNLICGGTFTSINGVNANHIVKWDGSRWRGLGNGVDGDVYCLHFDCNGKLYVGGTFKNAGDKPARGIAQWDGNQWYALDDGIDGKISAMVTDCNGNLYAGGLFDTAGTVPAKNIAQWNGITWLPLGAGFNAKVNTLYYYGNNLLCAGGAFTLSGNDTIRYMAEWNGSSWSEIYPGFDLDTVSSFTGDARRNLYSAIKNCVVVFNKTGDQWVFNPEYELLYTYSIGVSLGTKVNQVFYDIDGNLYFRKGTRIYRWNDNKIDSLICNVDRYINAFAVSGNDVYIGGNFFKIGDTVSAGIARFFFRDKNSISDYLRAPSLNNNFRFRLSRSKLTVNNFSNGDQIALYSVSGALLRKGVCGIPLDCSGIARQPVVIRISRSGKNVYSGMLLLQ